MKAAPAANAAEKPFAETLSEHGTAQPPSSGLDGLTLFERLIIGELRELNETLGYMAHLMSEHAESEEQGDDDEPPTHYLNGQRIS